MKWRYAQQLGIQQRTKEVLKLAIAATRRQLEHEHKKLKKIKYGA